MKITLVNPNVIECYPHVAKVYIKSPAYTLQRPSCYQAVEEFLKMYLDNYSHGKTVVFSNYKSRLRADALKFQNFLAIDVTMNTVQKREVINNFVYGDQKF